MGSVSLNFRDGASAGSCLVNMAISTKMTWLMNPQASVSKEVVSCFGRLFQFFKANCIS